MVRGYVRVGATNDLPLLQPLLRDRTENAQGLHALAGVEDVVDNAFEVVGVIGVGHHLRGVGGGHLEGVDELPLIVAMTEHFHQALGIPNVLQFAK